MFIHGAGGIGQTYVGSCGDAPDNKYFDPAILHTATAYNNTYAGVYATVVRAGAIKVGDPVRPLG